MFGYSCDLLTDTEVITYIVDYLGRKLGLTYREIANVIAAPFWSTIAKAGADRSASSLDLPAQRLRLPAGDRSVFHPGRLHGRPDGSQRPAQAAFDGRGRKRATRVYIASPRNAPSAPSSRTLDRIWAPRGGEPVIVNLHGWSESNNGYRLFVSCSIEVVRNYDRLHRAVARASGECANDAYDFYDPEFQKRMTGRRRPSASPATRCVSLCPTRALQHCQKPTIPLKKMRTGRARPSPRSTVKLSTGGVLLSSMGNPEPYPIYWDRLLINASQVTNPSIDPLREPMEHANLSRQKAGPNRARRGRQPSTQPVSPARRCDVPVHVLGHELRLHFLQRARVRSPVRPARNRAPTV